MAEAGTGVGKSLAYLLPAMYFAQMNNEKVIISTATITLQQQLYEKDIPLVTSTMDKKIKAVIMKGRNNYLCLRRLDDALKDQLLFDDSYEEIKNINNWSFTTKSGAKNELSPTPSDFAWLNVCSESDLCLGNHCMWRDRCFVLALRREANNAHVIVVNHHLLFADLAARYEGAGYESAVVLPPFNRLILDEAHTIENAATSFFSAEFGRAGIFRQLGRLYNKRRANKHGLLIKLCAIIPINDDSLDEMADLILKIRTSCEELDECALQLCGIEGIFRVSSSVDEAFLKKSLFVHFKAFRRDLLNLTNVIRDITENIDEEKAIDPVIWEIKTIIRRLENAADICDVFCKYRKHEDEVLWIERHPRSGAVFTRTPLDLAQKLKDSVFMPNKTVVCVSATLALNENFSYWANRSGISIIENRQILSGCFSSPFPYSSAVLLTSPTDAPSPNEDGYKEFVDSAAGRIAAAAGGSALILFTSYQSLTSAYNASKEELTSLGINCLKQGDDDRTRLLQKFLSDKNSCLFATDSFWEGVDAPGDTLRLVIICRLPFRTPGDPVFEARREALEKEGLNPFTQLSLPQAVMKFKQGFGRLMRRSADSGVVAVLDSRIFKKTYGRLFLQSLPETRTSFGELNNIILDIENFLYK